MFEATWWESAITGLLLVGFGVPIAVWTEAGPLVAVGLASLLVLSVNVTYWQYRGVPLREVYR